MEKPNFNLLNKKTKRNPNSLIPEIQDNFSTNINFTTSPSSFMPLNLNFSSIENDKENDRTFSDINELLNLPLSNFDNSLDNIFFREEALSNYDSINQNQNFIPNINVSNPINNYGNEENLNSKNKRGRKTNMQKAMGIKGKHTKFIDGNKLRKAKVIIFQAIFQIINLFLKRIDKNKQIKRLKNEQTKELGIEYNRRLLKTKIKDIFSKDISSKYKNVNSDYNEKIITSIYDKKEENIEVIKFLEKTLEECLQDFKDEKNENELKKEMEKVFDKNLKNENDQYKTEIKNKIDDFVEIFQSKKSRLLRKK